MDTAGKKVPVRHCHDYIMVGQALENDLPPQMKSEMNAFVERELLTKTWMRAMSLKDPAAAKSDRPDHGPLGSYDGWPPLTMDTPPKWRSTRHSLSYAVPKPSRMKARLRRHTNFLARTAAVQTRWSGIVFYGGQTEQLGCARDC